MPNINYQNLYGVIINFYKQSILVVVGKLRWIVIADLIRNPLSSQNNSERGGILNQVQHMVHDDNIDVICPSPQQYHLDIS